jgi:PhnB protein
MANVSLDPYLFFKGNAREAAEFYKSVFGGELTVSTFGEYSGPEMPEMEGMDDKVMHAMLEGDIKMMFSDSRQASEKAAKIELSLSGDDEERLSGYFKDLSEGGEVKMPLSKAPWGDTFGQINMVLAGWLI